MCKKYDLSLHITNHESKKKNKNGNILGSHAIEESSLPNTVQDAINV